MKILEKPNMLRPSFGVKPCCSTNTIRTTVQVIKENKVADAFKKLSEMFKQVNEVGKFEPIKVKIESPVKNTLVKDSWLIIEPSANKSDFRTRVLTFLSKSPFDGHTKRSVVQATGNKFALESVLKDPSTATAFKSFIKDSETFFLTNYNL